MAVFVANEAVDMRVLPEIASTINSVFLIAYSNSYLRVADVGDFTFVYTGPGLGPPTGLAVINESGVAYEFRDMDLPTSGFIPTTLDELLAVALGGVDSVLGSEEGDYLRGLAGSDIVEGRGGDDMINGGADKDKLWGNDGRDTFVFDILPDSSKLADVVKDFTRKDTIGLAGSVFTALGDEVNKKEFVVGKKAKDKNDHLIYDENKGGLYYDDNGKKDGGKVKIAKLDADLDLSHKDFDILV